jgi:hypothetical protein
VTVKATAYDIRKTQLSIEEVWHERGPRRAQPLLVGTALAVINNPYAGRYEADLMGFQAALRDLGRQLARTLSERLGGKDVIEAYGKGAIVGGDGELEHGAVWHEAGGAVGARIMVPLGHIEAAYVRSHFGTAEMTIWDAPRRDEIVFGLVMATGGRTHARIGGLSVDEISVHDGQR